MSQSVTGHSRECVVRAGRFFRDRLLSRLEFTGWFLFDGSDDWNFASQHGTPILARPFTNALTGQPDGAAVEPARRRRRNSGGSLPAASLRIRSAGLLLSHR